MKTTVKKDKKGFNGPVSEVGNKVDITALIVNQIGSHNNKFIKKQKKINLNRQLSIFDPALDLHTLEYIR